MTNVLELLADIGSSDRRKEVAEYINSHQNEFEKVLTSVFVSDDNQPKQHILDLVDLLSAKLAVQVIERAIVDIDSRVKVRGLQAAYRTRVDSLNPQLAEILADMQEEFEVRKWIVHILGSTDPVSYGRILRKTARDSKDDVNLRKEAVFALTKVAGDETLGTLCALLGDSNAEMRESGAWALSNISAPESINCLLAALEDESEKVRDWAIRGLRDMDDTKALQGLADVMAQVPPSEQVRMIRLVVERKSEIILRAITEMLSLDDVEVLQTAGWAIGVSPYPPAVPVLRELMGHDDEQVRYYAKVALVRSGGIDPTDLQL
ncbi:MAG: HEAT repeat domain-containing protein [Candidatus Thorarchaeota archaeon]